MRLFDTNRNAVSRVLRISLQAKLEAIQSTIVVKLALLLLKRLNSMAAHFGEGRAQLQ